MPGAPDGDPKSEELTALIAEIRERVRARYPSGAVGGLALPDLMGILHARDAAQSKVAAIGSVNPRPPGLLNHAIQWAKRTVARSLDWHVREQVEFNRGVVAAIEAVIEALNENNRALAELADIRTHWAEWRPAWEQRQATAESGMLQAIAELKGAFDFRATEMSEQIQRRLWADLERMRSEYEQLIHSELRLVRQRAALSFPSAPTTGPEKGRECAQAGFVDYARFSERFRGPEERVRERQRFYLPYFQTCADVLDLGCGRGEFLEVMKEAGVRARGVELDPELAAVCRAKGLDVAAADLFAYLRAVAGESLDGVFSAHVIEHLPGERLPELVRTAAGKLRRGGILAFETPNPECLAIFATHFYLDPTHVRPVPPRLLSFYLEEAGFGRIEIRQLSPAIDETPSIGSLPENFRNAFFGGLDYAIIGRKL